MALPLPMALCLSPGSMSHNRIGNFLSASIIPESRSKLQGNFMGIATHTGSISIELGYA